MAARCFSEAHMSEEETKPIKEFTGFNHVFEDDFNAVDASMFRWYVQFDNILNLKFYRSQFTTGSVQYYLNSDDKLMWTMEIHKIDAYRVRLFIHLPPNTTREDVGLTAESLAAGFLGWRAIDRNRPTDSPIMLDTVTDILKNIHTEVAGPGRPISDTNQWLRNQIAKGHNPNQLFPEYLERKGIKPSNKAAREKARESFRQAVRRATRTK